MAGFLGVDELVLSGQQRPGEAISEEAKTREQGETYEECPNDERWDPRPVSDPARNTTQPPVSSSTDALPADPIEARRRRALWRGCSGWVLVPARWLLKSSRCGHRLRSLRFPVSNMRPTGTMD